MSEARAFAPRVTVVPATLNRFTAMPIHNTRKRRVAAYARVSTKEEEQLNSYDVQKRYYTEKIQSEPKWFAFLINNVFVIEWFICCKHTFCECAGLCTVFRKV